MSKKSEDRLDRLEQLVADYIEESRADRADAVEDRKEMRAAMKSVSTAIAQLTNLQMQYYRDAIDPVLSPNSGD